MENSYGTCASSQNHTILCVLLSGISYRSAVMSLHNFIPLYYCWQHMSSLENVHIIHVANYIENDIRQRSVLTNIKKKLFFFSSFSDNFRSLLLFSHYPDVFWVQHWGEIIVGLGKGACQIFCVSWGSKATLRGWWPQVGGEPGWGWSAGGLWWGWRGRWCWQGCLCCSWTTGRPCG